MRSSLLVASLFGLLLSAPTVHAAVPNAANSFVSCLTACPFGDLPDTVIVRDAAFNPVANSLVELNFSGCPSFVACPAVAGQFYTWDPVGRRAFRFTDASGTAFFDLRGGGVCGSGTVTVRADGVPLALRALVSPDQNGDLVVDAADAAILAPKVGTSDATADLDCDGFVTQPEVTTLLTHDGHFCTPPVPARTRSWGTLKLYYR